MAKLEMAQRWAMVHTACAVALACSPVMAQKITPAEREATVQRLRPLADRGDQFAQLHLCSVLPDPDVPMQSFKAEPIVEALKWCNIAAGVEVTDDVRARPRDPTVAANARNIVQLLARALSTLDVSFVRQANGRSRAWKPRAD